MWLGKPSRKGSGMSNTAQAEDGGVGVPGGPTLSSERLPALPAPPFHPASVQHARRAPGLCRLHLSAGAGRTLTQFEQGEL